MAKEIKVALTLDTKNFNTKMASAKAQMGGFDKGTKTANAGLLAMAGRLVPVIAGVAGLTAGFKSLSASLNVASKFEDVRVTLTNIVGSAEGGAAALEVIKQAAEELPVAFEDLAGAAPALATVSGDIGELEENMLLAADIAATFGIPFQDAASQLQRSFSAGAGAADIFREKGVLAAAGFEQGVSYSVDETIAKLREFGEEVEGAAQTLNQTFSGASSQAGDALTLFQASIGDAMLPEFTAFLNELVKVFRENKDEILAFGKAIGERVIASIIFALRYFATMADIVASVGQVATRVGKAFKENFGEQINQVVSVVVRSLAAVVEGLGYVGLGLGKLISMVSGEESIENFFENIVDGAKAVRTEGLDAIEDVSDGLGTMIPVTTNRDAINQLIENMQDGADKIRKETSGLVDDIDGDMRDINIALSGGAGGGTFAPIVGTTGMSEFGNKLASILQVDPFQALIEGMKDTSSNMRILDLAFGDNIGAIQRAIEAYDILQLAQKENLITQEDYKRTIKLIEEEFEALGIEMTEIVPLIKLVDETFASQEGMRSFLETLGQAQVTLSESLADAFLNGKDAMESFRDFFKTLITQIIADTLRLMIIQPILSSLFGINFGAGGKVTGLDFGGSFFGGLFGGGKAQGGPVMAGKTYLVGEKGPELLSMGRNNGTIIPNDQMMGGVTNVNYTIQAVDAPSFQALVASDPEFLFSVTEAGRRRIPGVRL